MLDELLFDAYQPALAHGEHCAHPIVIECIFLSPQGINASVQRYSSEVPCRIHPRGVLLLCRVENPRHPW